MPCSYFWTFAQCVLSMKTLKTALKSNIFSLIAQMSPNCKSMLEIWLRIPLCSTTLRFNVKNFMDPLEVVKKYWVAKIGVFRPLFCLGILGKSTSYSTGVFELDRTIWQDFMAFLWFFFITSSILLNWNKKWHRPLLNAS